MADEFNGEVVDLYIEHSFHTEFNKDCSECAKENDLIREYKDTHSNCCDGLITDDGRCSICKDGVK